MGFLWELGYFAEQNQNLIRAVLVSSGFSDVTLGAPSSIEFVMYFYIWSPIEVCKGSGSLARLARRILMFFIFDFGKNISLNVHLYQFFVFCFYLFLFFEMLK